MISYTYELIAEKLYRVTVAVPGTEEHIVFDCVVANDESELDEVVETTIGVMTAPQTEYSRPVPQSITRRQLLIQLKESGLISGAEAVAAAQTGAIPASVQDVFDGLPTQAERDNAAITWATMSVAERGHPLVAALASANEMNSSDIDEFFRLAAVR